MSEHTARIVWARGAAERFVDSRYSRVHTWEFDGGVRVAASSAVTSVPLPYSNADNVDPEEAFVAAIASCHMLTFLFLAARRGLVVDSYDDLARGTMSQDARGRFWLSAVRLAPQIAFSGSTPPGDALVDGLHHEAHEECYIANSVRTEITVVCAWTHRGG